MRKRGDQGWVARVARASNALDLEQGIFISDDPSSIARSLKRSAEASRRRKGSAFQAAMAMLCYHINRSGRRMPASRRAILEQAKDELRQLFGRRP